MELSLTDLRRPIQLPYHTLSQKHHVSYTMKNATHFLTWFQEHYQEFAGILFDIDGTIVRTKTPIEGAKAVLEFVESCQLPYIFLTNDACHSRQEKSSYLQTAGLPVTAEHIVSAGDALKLFGQQQQLQNE